MNKRIAVAGLLWLVGIAAVYGAGRKANESHSADTPEGFTDSIPIEEKKTGKWNFFMEAFDKGGNSTRFGPYNIYNDPVSDLPVVTVINPKLNMHIQGNVSIVGICSDDDAVDHVELTVTRGPGGRGEELIRARASGGAFWVYYLDTTDEEIWPDGVYTITAWGVDINGLSGISEDFKARDRKYHTVSWNLDRKKPKTRVASHEMGGLVAGKVNLKGTVYDGNGVQSLSYSLDGGNKYSPVALKHNKKTNISSWSLTIDTKALEEGPEVVWLRSHDGMGTMGLDAHLLFVNNTSPDVQILYPEPDAPVGGVFDVAIYAAHPVGIKSLTWKLGKDQAGEIPLIIGNAWYTQEFDIRGLKSGSADLEIRAEDLTGNVTVARRKLTINQEMTMPIVTLALPAANTVVGESSQGAQGLPIRGAARAANGDPILSVLYSLNGGDPTEVPSGENFQIMVTDLPAGTQTLEVWAKSIKNIEGPKVSVRGIIVPGPLPEPRIATVRLGTGRAQDTREFFSGIEIAPDARTVVEIAITAAAPITGATVSFAGQPAVAVSIRADRESGAFRGEVALPAGLREGLTEIELRATDRNGSEGVFLEYAYIGASRSPEFRWIRPNQNTDGRIMLGSAEEALTGLAGVPVTSLRLSGLGSENLRAEADEHGRVRLTAVAEGDFGPLTLSLNGGSLSSREFRILADFGGPAIELQAPPRWVQKSVPVQFTVADANGIAAVEYSINLGETWTHLLNSAEIAALRPRGFANFIERTLDIGALEDGAVTILIRAADRMSNYAIANAVVQKDTVAPRPELIMPVADASVNGTIRLAIAVEEAGTLSQVSYLQGANTRQVYVRPADDQNYAIPRFFDILLDFVEMPLRENMRFVFEDTAGNRGELNAWPFVIDNQMDIPIAHITLPLEGETLTADFEVSGVMFDDDAIKQIYWRIDNNAEQTLETGNGFSIPIPLSSLTDNEHKVTIVAEDIYGVKSEPVTRNFRVSLSEPIGVVTAPAFDILAAGLIEMSGGAFDDNGIAKVEVSLDSGNSFGETRLNAYGGTAEWFFVFNTVILEDGPNVVFLRVTDKYDISAIYASLLNVDNTLPVITLDSPTDGVVTTGKVNILGQIVDTNLEEKNMQLRSLEGRPIPQGFTRVRVGQTPMLREEFDLSALRDGYYNIEVTATDKAGNITSVSKNIQLSRESKTNSVDILYPLNGEHVQGSFNLYGNTGGSDKAETVTLRLNGVDVATAEVTWTGYYCFPLNEEFLENNLQAGWNEMVVHSDFGTENLVLSPTRRLHYETAGAWVTVDNLTMGDFAFDRPWFVGRAGYNLSEADLEILAEGKNADPEALAAVNDKKIEAIELSFDNGNTFTRAKRGRDAESDWSWRLETGEMKEGLHYILVRARIKNGEIAITRTVLQVDKTPPRIRVIAPEPGGHYNYELEYTAIASDDVALADLQYHLRIGDKAAYEIPGFLQGLYFESTIPPFIRHAANKAPAIFGGGSTYMDVGMGLSFFEDNVKIQVQYGFMFQKQYEQLGYFDSRSGEIAQVRYGGHVFGIKLLANVYTYPFAAAFGPDFEWLFGSIALGANFSLFDVGNTVNEKFAPETYTQSGKSTWMSALLLQFELPKVSIPKRKYLRTFSLFTEGQLWFVPTDVDADKLGIETVIPHIIMGLRLYIF